MYNAGERLGEFWALVADLGFVVGKFAGCSVVGIGSAVMPAGVPVYLIQRRRSDDGRSEAPAPDRVVLPDR